MIAWRFHEHSNARFLAVVATLAVPLTAQAQGTVRGAEEGATAGGNAAGPLGAIVGGAVGAVTGTVGGILGVEDRPRFREYVVRERRPSNNYQGDLRTGVILSEAGVEYYDVPSEYRVPAGYRYTLVNGRPVLIEYRTIERFTRAFYFASRQANSTTNAPAAAPITDVTSPPPSKSSRTA